MKSKGKKFLSALLVSSMVLTSSLGFMPRTAQAVDDSAIYSYGFEYINTVTKTGNKKVEVSFDKGLVLNGIDTTKFSIVTASGNDTSATIGVVDTDRSGEIDKLTVEINGIDPSETQYTLVIAPGGIEITGYQQLDDIRINFHSYDITPGFKSLFKDATAANEVFDSNTPEEISVYVNSGYVRNITAKNFNNQANWTEIKVQTANTHSVEIEVDGIAGDNIRQVDTTTGTEGEFAAVFADVTGDRDINVRAYDEAGLLLEETTAKIAFDSLDNDKGTTFKTEQVRDFDSESYTIRQILDGQDVTLDKLVEGLTYDKLDNLKVHYKGVDTFFEVGTAGELAEALGQMDDLVNKAATIKLTDDITISNEAVFTNDNLVIINGMGHTITGDIQLGDVSNGVVKLTNINVVGDVEVNVGSAAGANAYLTDVAITDGQLVVTSGAYSSIYLTRVTAPAMAVANANDVHVLALDGTVIGNTVLETTSKGKVKLTKMGGSFGDDILYKKTGSKLVLQGDKNKGYDFPQVTIDDTATNADIELGLNTKILNLISKVDLNMAGPETANVVKSSDSTGKITFDGFAINDATDNTEKYSAGPNVPSGSSSGVTEITVPTSNTNNIRLGGTVMNGLTGKEIKDNGATLTLTITSTKSDKPSTMVWDPAITATQAGDLLTASGAGESLVDSNPFTVEVINAGKTLKYIWTNPATDDDVLNTVAVNPTKLVKDRFKPDVSKVGTSDWTKAYEGSSFDTLYKPGFEGTDKFVVYPYSNLETTIKIAANVDLTAVGVEGLTSTYEYRINDDLDWTEGTGIFNLNGLFPGDANVLEVRVKGGNGEVQRFNINKNEPWFKTDDATGLYAAFKNEDVHKIHLETGIAYDFSAQAGLTAAEATAFRDKYFAGGFELVAENGPVTSVATAPGIDDAYITEVGTFTATVEGDTTKPTVSTTIVVNNTVQPNTITATLSEKVVQATAEDVSNWTITDNAGAITYTIASAAYTEGTDTIVFTLADVDGSDTKTFITTAAMTGLIKVTAKTGLEDLAGNGGVNVAVIDDTDDTGETTQPTAALVAKLTDDNGEVLNRAVKAGEIVFVEATFNEAMADTPIVTLETTTTVVGAVNMTKVTDTKYTAALTVPAGDGDAVYELKVGKDVAGNVITGAPTGSVTKFVVDNTAPTVAYTSSAGDTNLVMTITEAVSNLAISGVAIGDGDDIKDQFTLSDGTKSITSALYDTGAKTITFVIETGVADNATIVSKTTLTDLAGNSVSAVTDHYDGTTDNKWEDAAD